MEKVFISLGAVVLASLGAILHSVGYFIEPKVKERISPPPVAYKLDESLSTKDGDIIAVDYADHPITNRLERICPRTPVVVYGPSNVGKSTCMMRLVEHLQSKGEYAVYIPLREKASQAEMDAYIRSFIKPESKVAPPSYLNAAYVREDDEITKFLQSQLALRGKPVRLFIDDAQKLTKDSGCLGLLLEHMLKKQLEVVFITSNDDKRPAFLKSSGYTTRVKTLRFEQAGDLVLEALKESKFSDDERKLLVDSVGYSMGDIVNVLNVTKLEDLDIAGALDEVLREKADIIESEVAAVESNEEMVKRKSFTQMDNDAYDFLSKLTFDPKLASPLSDLTDLRQQARMRTLAEKLVAENILSKIGPRMYIWRSQAYATAFTKHISKKKRV